MAGKYRVNISDEELAMASNLRAAGMSWRNIGKRIGYYEDTIRERLEPEFAAAKRYRYSGPHELLRNGQQRMSRADEARLLNGVPVDTRTRYSRLMGDPIPGRSALDRKREERPRPPSIRAERGYYLRGFLG